MSYIEKGGVGFEPLVKMGDDKQMNMECSEIENIVKRWGFELMGTSETDDHCIIDFHHKKIKVGLPVSYFTSAASYNKKTGCINTTARAKVDEFKELYLDYCCEDGEQVCRPHVNMDEKIVSVEAHFCESPLVKFDRLLEELVKI